MSKKFVVALHEAPGLRDPITEYLLGQNWRVWHWYADLWLISEVPDSLTAGQVHLTIERAVPDLLRNSLLVLEMGPELRYYGRAPKSDAWPWMMAHWGLPDVPPAIIEIKTVASKSEEVEAEG